MSNETLLNSKALFRILKWNLKKFVMCSLWGCDLTDLRNENNAVWKKHKRFTYFFQVPMAWVLFTSPSVPKHLRVLSPERAVFTRAQSALLLGVTIGPWRNLKLLEWRQWNPNWFEFPSFYPGFGNPVWLINHFKNQKQENNKSQFLWLLVISPSELLQNETVEL